MQIKKFLATGLSAVMAGATLAGGALAATPLSDYPDFLGNNGQLDVFVVVGADAQPADIVGAGDVVAGLASLSYTMIDSTGTSTSVSGGKTEDIDVGTALNSTDAFGATVDDDDVSGFFDGEVTISISGSSESYDAHDELRLGNGGTGTIKVQTGLTAGSPDEDFGSDIFLEALTGSVEYRYVFDEDLRTGNLIANATNNDPIILNFMGRELRITGATATSITVEVGERFVLKAGESATTSDGKKVTLEKAISTSKAQVSVNGASDIIDENSVRQLGGTEVKVVDVADDDGIEFDSAVVIVGTAATNGEASDTFDDGEEYVIPCGTLWTSEDCDADNADWVWRLSGLTSGTASGIILGVRLDESIDTPEDNVPTVGDEDNHILDLPGGFAWISLDGVSTSKYQDYEFKDQVKDIRQGSGLVITSSARVLELNGEGEDDSFIVTVNGTNQDTDNLYLYINDTNNDTVSLFWEDPDDGNKIKFVTIVGDQGQVPVGGSVTLDWSANFAQIDFEGATVQMSLRGKRSGTDAAGGTNFTIDLQADANSAVTARNVSFFVEEDPSNAGQINYVGDTDSDTTTSNDVKYGSLDISGYEEDTRTAEGLIIRNPDSNAPSDRYKISVPSEYGANDFQVDVTIGASGTSVSTTSSGGIKQLVPITSSITKLDTEVTSADKAKNLVLVGGPAVNRLTAEAMGLTYPTYGAASGIPENAAWISIIDDAFTTGKAAVVVAGYEADNTRLATSLLQQAATKLAGESSSSVTVTGTSVASAVITAA